MVDEHHTSGDAFGHLGAMFGIGGEYRAAQTERLIVGNTHRVLLVPGTEDGRYWDELIVKEVFRALYLYCRY